jgi:tRNA (adenine37-N6)-methyltransferase
MSADEVNQPMVLRPVAVLRTPFMEKFGVPRQSGLVPEAEGRVVFAPEFAREEFVRGLEAFSHIWLITQFHHRIRCGRHATVRPPRLGGNERVGVFASRAPNRPNGLGLSLVRLLAIETVADVGVARCRNRRGGWDTPVFDVKPYLPWCEAPAGAQANWAQAAPAARAAEASSSHRSFGENYARDSGEGAPTLAMIRHLLQHDHQPAYQHDTGARVWDESWPGGMCVGGRWREIAWRCARWSGLGRDLARGLSCGGRAGVVRG